MRQGDWREVIGHDGYFVVRLRLFTVEEGGQRRHLQPGFKATWSASSIPHPMDGPILFADEGQRSQAPGGSATVHVHPMQPGAWIDVEPGMLLEMSKNWPRSLGEGVVLDRVRVPRRVVPIKVLRPPHGTAAVLHRPLTLRERIRSLLR